MLSIMNNNKFKLLNILKIKDTSQENSSFYNFSLKTDNDCDVNIMYITEQNKKDLTFNDSISIEIEKKIDLLVRINETEIIEKMKKEIFIDCSMSDFFSKDYMLKGYTVKKTDSTFKILFSIEPATPLWDAENDWSIFKLLSKLKIEKDSLSLKSINVLLTMSKKLNKIIENKEELLTIREMVKSYENESDFIEILDLNYGI